MGKYRCVGGKRTGKREDEEGKGVRKWGEKRGGKMKRKRWRKKGEGRYGRH